VIDMQRFMAIGNAAYETRRRAEGDRRWIETNSATGQQRVVTARELTPGYDQVRWESQRFFDDWTASSAGRAGERACQRWAFNTSDYTDSIRPPECLERVASTHLLVAIAACA
jgi:hypothetical protein